MSKKDTDKIPSVPTDSNGHLADDVQLRIRVSKELYNKIAKFRKKIGVHNDQSAIRVALTMYFNEKM